MIATYLAEITNKMIQNRLGEVTGCTVGWTGPMPAGCERWDALAQEKLASVTAGDVRKALEFHNLAGDDPEGEIDMAISIAAEPDELPEGACVELYVVEN